MCLQGITDEAAIQRGQERMYEIMYLANAQELAQVIEKVGIQKSYPWIFGEQGDLPKSSRRDKAQKVMEEYNNGNYTAPINSSERLSSEAPLITQPVPEN